MAYKNIEDSRAAIRRHYYANKQKYLERNRKRRQFMRDYIADIKNVTPCAECGRQYPYYVMDFDHLGDKQYLISKLVVVNNFSVLQRELKKCEVVCANCHRERTFRRLQENNL